MKSLRDIILDEQNNIDNVEYLDEAVLSNLYLSSLSHSLRKIASVSNEKDKSKMISENQWVRAAIPDAETIVIVSVDRLKENIKECVDFQTCDALSLFNEDYRLIDNERHLLLEFKRTKRSRLIELIDSELKDSIVGKCRGTAQMIENYLYFFDEEDGKDIIRNTHVMLVYAEKSDGVKEGPPIPQYDSNLVKNEGRQRRASRMGSFRFQPGKKKDEDAQKKFAEKVATLGFASSTKEYLCGITGEPEYQKAGKVKQRGFTMISVKDLAELVERGFFNKMIKDYGEMK